MMEILMSRIISADEVKQINAPTAFARSIPARILYAPEVYDQDRRQFRNEWMAIGFGADVPEPGCMKPIDFAGYPLLMTRQNDGSVQVFYNFCPHRGMPLLKQATKQRRLSCGYHCWTFDLSGELVATPHIDGIQKSTFDGQDKASNGLHRVRTEMWFDMIFVNLSGDAPPLLDHLAPLVERIPASNLAAAKADGEFPEYVRDANWKVVIETGIEDYHLPFIHSTLNYNESYTDENGGDAYQGFTAVWPMETFRVRAGDDAGDQSDELPLFPTYAGKETGESGIFFLYPTGQLTIGANHIRLTTLNPVAADKTILRHSFYYCGDAATDPTFAGTRKEVRDFWEMVGNEDDDLMRVMQSTTRAREEAGVYGSYSPRWERNLHAFHQHLARRYERV
jgi:choline monooxygenase